MAPSVPLPIIGLFTKNWWVLLLRGIVAILFGVFALSLPLLALTTLVLLFGVYAIVDGAFSLFGALSGWQHSENRWLLFLEGLVGLGAGFITLRAPVISATVLIFFIAVWALATGVLRIIEAIRVRREISGEFWLALSGIASMVFALLVMLRPAAGALAMVWVIGWYAIIAGAALVLFSFRLRTLRSRTVTTEYRRAA